MTGLLPVGTRILVRPFDSEPQNAPYFGIIRGYDMGRTKYRVSPRFAGWGEWLYSEEAYCWPFPSQCREIEPGEDSDARDLRERTSK
jgi:hypothetical protein